MEMLSFALGGVGLIVLGGHEAYVHGSDSPKEADKKRSSPLFWIGVMIFASLLVVNSTVSLLDAHKSNDAVGSALQLQVIPIGFIFLFYSLLHLLKVSLPYPLVGLVAAFAFVEEFLVFYLQRKDPNGVENRYYDLLLVPISLCVFSTLLDLTSPHSNFPKLGRAVGLILHGTWFLQMGLSFFSGWVAQGCSLHRVSRGNYSLRCKGHPEYHRARAIATLQFNCHLALLVLVVVAAFSFISSRNGLPLHSISTPYAPLGEAELHSFDTDSPNFTLDSDHDEDDTQEDKVLVLQHPINANGIAIANGNGNASHH